MFTAGRDEYRNKGIDMFIESLARKYLPLFNMANLDYRLQKSGSTVTVIAFTIMPAAIYS